MLPFDKVHIEKKILKKILKLSLIYLNKKKVLGSIIFKKKYGLKISVRHGLIDFIEQYNDSKCIIIIYNKQKKSEVFLNNLNIFEIYNAIDYAIYISKFTQFDNFLNLPNFSLLFKKNKAKLGVYFPWNCNIDKVRKLVLLTDYISLNCDSRIINTDGSYFDSFLSIKLLGHSSGWIGDEISTLNYLSNFLIAKDKKSMERHGSYTISRDFYDLKSPEQIAVESISKSVLKLHSKRVVTQFNSVIFSLDVSYYIFFVLFLSLNGHSVYKKTTFLLNFLHKEIFPNWLNIFENPFLYKGLASKFFDIEGVATKNKKIVCCGKVKTWLLDTYSANKLNLNSTGHAGGISNWIISIDKSHTLSYKKILKIMNTGLLVTELIGDGLNIITGDYSQGVCGFWVENGSIQYPVSNVVISGNFLKMWKEIICLSENFTWNNNIFCSDVLINSMKISGI